MRWSGLAWMLVLGACTSENPDFDGEVGPIPMNDTDDETAGLTASPSSGLVTTDSATQSGTSAGTSGDESPVGDSSSDDTAETGSDFDVPAGLCPDEPEAPFSIRLTDPTGHVTPDCAPFDVVGDVVVSKGGEEITIAWCDDACTCETGAAMYTVSFGEEGTVPDVYGGCRHVRLWASEVAGVIGCEWVGFSVSPSDGGSPLVIGSNRLEADLGEALGIVELRFGEGEQCSDRGCPDDTPSPGSYALSVEGAEVWPEDPVTQVAIAEKEYDFDNRMSHVNGECEPRVSWWAELK